MNRGSIEISIYEAPASTGALERPSSVSSYGAVTPRSAERLHAGGRGPSASRCFTTRVSYVQHSQRRLTAGVTAALLSVALHALLVTSMLWGAGAPTPRPRDAGALNAVAAEAADDGALRVIFVQDPESAPPSSFAAASSALASAPALADPSSKALASLAQSLPDVTVDPASTAATPAPDAALRSALYGRYVGQIDARIDRAWLRPRSAIGAPTFSCRVRIDQDSHGMVQEVTLEQCNGSARWQHSLVRAIESASPLPAPPDPVVFTRILHLSFQSQPYSANAPQDAYEPVSLADTLPPRE